jgi:hypothetical protein
MRKPFEGLEYYNKSLKYRHIVCWLVDCSRTCYGQSNMHWNRSNKRRRTPEKLRYLNALVSHVLADKSAKPLGLASASHAGCDEPLSLILIFPHILNQSMLWRMIRLNGGRWDCPILSTVDNTIYYIWLTDWCGLIDWLIAWWGLIDWLIDRLIACLIDVD